MRKSQSEAGVDRPKVVSNLLYRDGLFSSCRDHANARNPLHRTRSCSSYIFGPLLSATTARMQAFC